MNRYAIFRSKESKNVLCYCAARDAKHALKIARGIWTLTRTATATRVDWRVA